jgi:hypothetical protein
MSTAQAIVDYSRENLKIDPSKTIWTDVQLLRWLNEATKKLRAKADWKDVEAADTIVLVNGTATYTPATDYNRLIDNSVIFTTAGGQEANVKYVELNELQATYYDLTTTGDAPEWIYETGGTLGFYPVPNATAATGTLDYGYYSYPATYALGDTIVGLEAEYTDVLEDYVNYKAWKQLPGREQSSNLSFQRWELGVSGIKADRLRRSGPMLQFRNVTKQQKDN